MALIDLLPLFSQQQGQSGRDKRSWFPFHGEALKTILGTSTDEDLKVLDEHVKALAATVKGEDNEMKKFSEHMSSYMATNDRPRLRGRFPSERRHASRDTDIVFDPRSSRQFR